MKRNLTKRLFTGFLALVMLFSLLPSAALAAEETDPVPVGLAAGQSAMYTVTGSYETYSGGGSIASAALSVSPGTEAAAAAQLGSDANYSGDYVSLDSALFTFTGSGTSYTVSATLSDDTTVYLNPAQGSVGYPCNTTSGTVTIAAGDTEGTFSLQGAEGGSGIGRYLYFWRNGNNYFDRYGVTASPATDFLLYRPAEDGEASSAEIPGYVQVTDVDTLTEGRYLILALYDGTYYALYPSASTSDKYSHVAAVRVFEAEPDITTVTITGVTAGETSIVVGDTTFSVTVSDPVCTDAATGVSVNFGAAFAPGMTVTAATVAALEDAVYTAYDITPEGYTGSAQVTIPLTEELKNCETLTGFVMEHGSVRFITGTRNRDSYTFTTPHFSVIGVAGDVGTVTVAVNGTATYVIPDYNYAGAGPYETDDPNIATVEVTGNDADASIETYTEYDATYSELFSGKSTSSWTAASGFYYKADDGNYYPVYAQRSQDSTSYTYTWGYSTSNSSNDVVTLPPTETVNRVDASSTVANITVYRKSETIATAASTTIVFTGVAAGTTTVTVGDTTYTIQVLDVLPTTETVTIGVGETVRYTDDSDYYKNSDLSSLNTSIATVTVTGTPAAKTLGSRLTLPKVANVSQDGVLTDGLGHYLTLNGDEVSTTTNIDEATVWTVTCISAGTTPTYAIQSGTSYLVYTVSNKKPTGLSVSPSNTNGTWRYNPSYGFYASSSYYLYYSNGSWQFIISPSTTSGAGKLYSYTEGGAFTTVEITGVAAGSTSVTVGNTTYNITVTGDTPVEPSTVEVSLAQGDNYIVTDVTDSSLNNIDDGIITTALSEDGTLTITGKAPGQTSVTVGSTTYNITVYTVKQVNLAPKGIHTFHGLEGNLDLGNMDPNIANAEKKEDEGEPRLVITAKDQPGEQTDFMMGFIKFIVKINENAPVDVTLKVGESQDFSTSATDITQDYNTDYVDVALTAAGSADTGVATLSLDNGTSAATFALSNDESTNTLTFTGKAVGTTEVTVGDTVYNVTVTADETPVTETVEVTLSPGGVYTVTVPADSSLNKTQLNEEVATAALADGILTITGGTTLDTTSVTVGSTQYNITVTDPIQIQVILAVGDSRTYTTTATTVVGLNSNVTSELKDGSVTFTGVSSCFASFILGDTVYHVTVKDSVDSGVPASPEDGTTTGNPFPQGTGDSNSFRIPAMVTLSDGTIVAAADARWNTTYDGGGLDTIAAYSTDNGANWSYTFANYLGDNGNEYNGSGSTAFIDPALAVDANDTVYMLCDLYPYGVALNGSGNTAPSTAVGFNGDGKLLLSADGTNYNYYLDGTQIKDSSGNVVSGYTVDAYFNVFQNGTYVSNLFFSDFPYKVVRTGYLYLTKSTDGGKTWSAPTLIPNVKTSSEQVCLVGPGRGLVTSGGTIIFPVYSYNGSSSSQQTGFIYSTDGGKTWTRSANYTGDSWSSESAVVELSDGTLRFFYRNGNSKLYYVDYNVSGGTWGSAVNTGIATNSNTQISAISYSKTVDGKQVILLSCPTGANEAGSNQSGASYRLNGKIFVGLVESDKTITWQNDAKISVPSVHSTDQFMYSCLTELSDGRIAILYEDNESAWGTGADCYYEMSYATYPLDLDFDEESTKAGFVDSNNQIITEYSMLISDVATIKFDGLESDQVLEIIDNSDKTVVTAALNSTSDGLDLTPLKVGTATITARVASRSSSTSYALARTAAVGDTYTLKVTVTSTDKEKYITLKVGESETVTDETGNYQDNISKTPDTSIATMDVVGTSVSTDGSYAKATSITSGKQYLITIDGNHVVTNTASTNGRSDYGYWSGASGLYIESVSGFAYGNGLEQYLWTITESDSGYTLQNANGKYLTIGSGNNNVTLSDTAQVLTVTDNGDTFDFSNGNYYLNNFGGTDYDLFASSWENGNSGWTLYEYTPGAAENTTDITFTGVSAGETTAVVGDTTYYITVERKTQTVNIAVDGTATFTDASTGTPDVADSSVATATLADGKLTITGLTDGTTTITTDTTVYTVTVSEGTPISIKENETTTISVTLEDGQTVEWSSADSSYVGVAGKYIPGENVGEGSYGDEAILAGQNVTESPVVVTATVKDADGNVVRTEKWLVTVTKGDEDTYTSSKEIYLTVETIEHCTVYYSINGGELIPINGTGVTLGDWDGNGTYTGHFNIMFFAAPDDGYALTYMDIEFPGDPGADQYYSLANGNPDGTGSEAWPFISADQSEIPSDVSDETVWKKVNNTLHGFRWALYQGNMTIDQMKVLFSNAISLGCVGATTFTKNDTDGAGSESNMVKLGFVAQELASVKKELTSVTFNDGADERTTDADGTWGIKLNDTINYTITITIPAFIDEDADNTADYGYITYTNLYLTDVMLGDQELFANAGGTLTYTSGPDLTTTDSDGNTLSTIKVNDTVPNGSLICSAINQGSSDIKLVFTASLKLTLESYQVLFKTTDTSMSNIITNSAVFTFDSSSLYTQSIQSSSADAAVINATMWYDTYVVDFGLPVTISLADSPLISDGCTLIGKAESKFDQDDDPNNDGVAVITVDTAAKELTYTLKKPLTEFDEVTYYGKKSDDDNTEWFYKIYIIPASNVLYEESFLEPGPQQSSSALTWTQYPENAGENSVKKQESPASDTPYGYDPFYETNMGYSDDSYWKVDGLSSTNRVSAPLTTTFYGTGFDLIGDCGPNTGLILMVFQDQDTSNGNSSKMVIVDTRLSTNASLETIHQVPLGHVELTEETYKVSIFAYYAKGDTTHDEGTYAVIDGFRVYRSTHNPSYDEDEYDATYYNILDAIKSDGFAAFIEAEMDAESNQISFTLSDYEEKGGPKDEVYLSYNQSVTLKTTYAAGSTIQVSARAVTGQTTGLNGTEIKSNTEMYYEITVASDGIVTLSNTTEGSLLALGFVKVAPTGSSAAESALALLSEDDVVQSYALIRRALFAADTPDLGTGDDLTEPDDPDTGDESLDTDSSDTADESGGVDEPYAPVISSFQPETMDLGVESTVQDGQKYVTLTVTASTDVSKLTINGTAVWASNLTQVRKGLESEYCYTKLLVVPVGDLARFEVVAYDQNGQASITYTMFG